MSNWIALYWLDQGQKLESAIDSFLQIFIDPNDPAQVAWVWWDLEYTIPAIFISVPATLEHIAIILLFWTIFAELSRAHTAGTNLIEV
ncbi:hypothetical protein [Stratiformator vulcanicus]|uniref:hypothetical protein n=1 Tax=Stratiformator vulcanicus TaxID=2527980 RepID=UPI0011A395AD|nr:hypothetical protein [Stratiformator vulcanicus]